MNRVRSILPYVFLAAAAAVLWYLLFPPPEKVIRKKLDALARTISETPRGNISRVANVNRIGSFFHPNVSINVEGFGRDTTSINGRGEIEQTAMAVRQSDFLITVHFSNLHITVGPDKTDASVIATAEVTLGQGQPIVQDLRLTFEKYDRAWLIRSAEPARALKIE